MAAQEEQIQLPKRDANVISLLNADTEVVTIFGKSWDFQVTEILKTTLEENLKMIYDTVKFLKTKVSQLYLMQSIF